MPSTFSSILKTELPALGEQAGTWGNTNNYNLGTILEAAIAGVANIVVTTADYILSNGDGSAPNEARSAVIQVSGAMTAARSVIVPNATKGWWFYNGCSGGFALTVKTAAGSGVAIPAGKYLYVVCNGTNVIDPTGASTNVLTAPSLTLNGVANQGFPAGTRMLFNQTAAPTGWTKDTTAALNDTSLRIVTGAVGSGGSVAFTTAFASQAVAGSVNSGGGSTTGATTLTVAQMPAHTHMQMAGPHTVWAYGSPTANGLFGGGTADDPGYVAATSSAGSSAPHSHTTPNHTHTFTGTALNLAVKYNDVIIASKA